MADNQNNNQDSEEQLPDVQGDVTQHNMHPESMGEKGPRNGNSPSGVDRDGELKNLRTLMLIAGVGGPFSFIIGGVFLSTISLVCSLIAMNKFKKLFIGGVDDARIKRAIVISIVISLVALVWNIAWVVMVLPEVWEMIKSQDFSGLYGTTTGDVPEKTIWD